jgi:uracil-DNA glycosylase family 4
MLLESPVPESEAPRDCPLCPRLVGLREQLRLAYPDWWNAPVPAFGDRDAWLGIVGLAPGMFGANRTGRPFTGDFAGDMLYGTLISFGFAHGRYQARPDDGLTLAETAITNAVRCVPPENKPVGLEIGTCRQFLTPTIAQFPKLEAVLSLGAIAHQSAVRALGGRVTMHPFRHAAQNPIGHVTLFSSYHCSRYNTNTGVLTPKMFKQVFANVRAYLTKSGR